MQILQLSATKRSKILFFTTALKNGVSNLFLSVLFSLTGWGWQKNILKCPSVRWHGQNQLQGWNQLIWCHKKCSDGLDLKTHVTLFNHNHLTPSSKLIRDSFLSFAESAFFGVWFSRFFQVLQICDRRNAVVTRMASAMLPPSPSHLHYLVDVSGTRVLIGSPIFRVFVLKILGYSNTLKHLANYWLPANPVRDDK